MTNEQLQQLARIYNTLLTVTTKGEDTVIMADCIRAFQAVLLEIRDSMGSDAITPVEAAPDLPATEE